jgi:hypothetical protein
MKDILKYTALLFFGFLWFLGCSKTTTKYLYEKGILKDDYRYGDLYRLSNLEQFKESSAKCESLKIANHTDATLYLAGDSFTEEGRIGAEDFLAKNYQRFEVAKPNEPLKLTNGRKILVIETVERHLRERFTTVWSNLDTTALQKELREEKSFTDKMIDLKVPYSEELHQAALFGFDFIMKIKEWKAALNHEVFGRVDEKVKLSSDEKQILYYLDNDPGVSSNFDEVSNKEIENMVKNINATYEKYLKLGFDEVYLSIIPNKTTRYGKDLGHYNQLIDRIEHNPDLKMPVISVLKEFESGDYYLKGDSHWNCAGQQLWLNKVNQAISKTQ